MKINIRGLKIKNDFLHKGLTTIIPSFIIFIAYLVAITLMGFFFKDLRKSPDFWSALAALGSFSVAILMFNNDKNQKESDFKSDLYNLISVLIGFVDFVQKTIAHNTTACEC